MRERGSFRVEVGQHAVLEQERGRVDSHAGNATVEPEAQHVLVLPTDLLVVPVEIRLLGREEMQVPLARRAVGVLRACPGAATEDRRPIVRRQLPVSAAAATKPEALAFGRAGPRCKRLAEPAMPTRAMVRDDVDDDPDAERGGLVDQALGLAERAEHRVDVAIVGDVVAAVRHRRRVPRREPDRVDPELAQVGQLRPHAGEIADAVTVPVREAPHVDLVDRQRCATRDGRCRRRWKPGPSGRLWVSMSWPRRSAETTGIAAKSPRFSART